MKWMIFMLMTLTASAQSVDYNTKNGYVAEGYDVVSYFKGQPLEGKESFLVEYDGVKFRFSSGENKESFLAEPERYIPQYGGWCAWAIAENNSKVDINPKTYEIRDGKLYLFYNAFFNNTLESWKEKGPEELIPKADNNWKDLKDPGK